MLKHVARTAVEVERFPPVTRRQSLFPRKLRPMSAASNSYESLLFRQKRGRLKSFSLPCSVVDPEVMYYFFKKAKNHLANICNCCQLESCLNMPYAVFVCVGNGFNKTSKHPHKNFVVSTISCRYL